MNQISRRAFVSTGAAASLASAAGISAMPVVAPSEHSSRQRPEFTQTTVKLTGDGPSLTPLEYSQVLASIIDETGVAPDYYSRGGVVRELEERMAGILGKERAVFLGTGTLANHLAVRIQARGNTRVIVQEDSHLYCDSGDCAEVLSNLNLVTLARGAGTFTLEDVQSVIERASGGRVRTGVGVVSIESPIRRRFGELFDHAEMRRICDFAREQGIATHLDGARLFMASAYTGIAPAEVAALFDTVYVSMWKYFNAPSGAILAGPADLLDDLYHPRRMFGGALPGAWPLAAVALHFIEGFEERFAAGVRVSEELLPMLDAIGPLRVQRIPNGSNVFKLYVDAGNPDAVRERLAGQDVVVPRPASDFRGFRLKVNETLARRPAAATARAFETAVQA
jgi:threonine aldolase